MSPLFGANKGNSEDIMKELKERREQKMMGKQEVGTGGNQNNASEKLEEGDQEKINKFGNILIQGTLKKRNFI